MKRNRLKKSETLGCFQVYLFFNYFFNLNHVEEHKPCEAPHVVL